ncbi:hypothetical protein V1511DRAFT_521402 [Dipodascopsis uninucleata]
MSDLQCDARVNDVKDGENRGRKLSRNEAAATAAENRLDQQQNHHLPENTEIIRAGSPASSESSPEREYIKPDSELVEGLPLDVSAIDFVQMRIQSMIDLDLSRFQYLENLCLRENLITVIEGLENASPVLKELDLYDNRIKHIENLENTPFRDVIENLDLSFNKIKAISNVNKLKNLRNLYFVQNKISKIENLDGLDNLVNLELGGNRLRVLENLDNLSSLQELWVGKNKITKLQGFASLSNLKILSIQANRIVKLEGLEDLRSLEELYISHNGIETIGGLEKNSNLRVLDIGNNKIEHLENLSHLKNLEELWASYNKIRSFEEVERELKDLPNLNTVYFEGNLLQTENMATYRNKLRLLLGPNLKQIDATPVRREA